MTETDSEYADKQHYTCPYNGRECHVSYCKFERDYIICETYRRLEAKSEKECIIISADRKTARAIETLLGERIVSIEICRGSKAKIHNIKDLKTLN